DPVSKFLPKSVKVPARNGREITLADLATHTSGLPRLPDNMGKLRMLLHMDNPYADYSVEDLYAFLSGYTLPRDIGAEYEYSNLGGGLLGHVLALKSSGIMEAPAAIALSSVSIKRTSAAWWFWLIRQMMWTTSALIC